MTKCNFRQTRVCRSNIADYLSWLYFTENDYVATKNSLLLAFYELIPGGDYYDGEADEEAADALNSFIMNLPDNVTVWLEYQKNKPQDSVYQSNGHLFRSPFNRKLEEIRSSEFSGYANIFQARRFLTVCYPITLSPSGISEETFSEFGKILTDMEGRFDRAKIKAQKLKKEEVCNYLHSIISSKQHRIKVPSASYSALSDTLWDDDIDKSLVPLKLGDSYISIIAIDDFPGDGTTAEMLNEITKIEANIRWVNRWVSVSQEKAKKTIDDRRRKYLSRRFSARDIAAHSIFKADIELEDVQALSQVDECSFAMQINGDSVGFGYFSGQFVIRAQSEAELKKTVFAIEQILSKKGFIYRSETLNLFGAWVGSLPGNIEANPRRQFISTGNLSSVSSLTSPYCGIKENHFLKQISGVGVPNAYGLLPTGDIYSLNLNGQGDLGHSFIIGPSGAGKSILLSFLAASWGKYPDSRVVFFDKGLTSKSLVEGNGGIILNPGKDETTFLPLKNAAKDPVQLERCMRFLESIAAVSGITLSPSEKENMIETLKLLVPGHESLSIFRTMLKGRDHDSDMVTALKNYCEGGALGGLFDANNDSLKIDSWPDMITFEMGTLMEIKETAVIPAITYIFGQLMLLFEDRKPTLLIFDEAWVFMKDEFMRTYLIECLKTLRKYNVFVVMATQEVSDYSPLMESIMTNCHTMILLPNSKALTGAMSSLYLNLGLSETDLFIISSEKHMRAKRDYYIIQDEGKAIVNFCLTPSQLSMLGGRDEKV